MTRFSPLVIIALVFTMGACGNSDENGLRNSEYYWSRGKLLSKAYYKNSASGMYESSRTEYTYDNQGRATGFRGYDNYRLYIAQGNYFYNGNVLTYKMSIGSSAVMQGEGINVKITYMGGYPFKKNKIRLFEYCDADGNPTKDRSESEFDFYERVIGSKSYTRKNELITLTKDYIYNDNEMRYTTIQFPHSETSLKEKVETKHRIVFFGSLFDPDKVYSSTLYKADGVTEIRKEEYKYDNLGREIGYKEYYNGSLVTEYTNYIYKDNKLEYREHLLNEAGSITTDYICQLVFYQKQ